MKTLPHLPEISREGIKTLIYPWTVDCSFYWLLWGKVSINFSKPVIKCSILEENFCGFGQDAHLSGHRLIKVVMFILLWWENSCKDYFIASAVRNRFDVNDIRGLKGNRLIYLPLGYLCRVSSFWFKEEYSGKKCFHDIFHMLQMSFKAHMAWFQLLNFKNCWKPFNGVIGSFYSNNVVGSEGVYKIKKEIHNLVWMYRHA